MGKISRRRHTREFKISIIRELESGKNVAQLSRENNLHPTMISRWKLEYRKNPESAFSGNGNTYKETAKIHELRVSPVFLSPRTLRKFADEKSMRLKHRLKKLSAVQEKIEDRKSGKKRNA